MPDGKGVALPAESAVISNASSGTGPPGHGRLISRADRPAVAGLIALLVALALAVARWLTWAHDSISRFILVGRHFATPSQLPPGMPLAKTYGYDGQFF